MISKPYRQIARQIVDNLAGLLESLHVPISDVEAAWAQEIEDRVAAFDRGETPAYPAEEVFAEARRLSR
jgi:putative addiction module component (TIGR02574 family)